ncbi:6-phospho-beta-glucosidase [Klebsiella electrica]
MSQKLKIVTIGGGSSYTPELLEGFIKRYHELPVTELWLVDVEEGREKLDIIHALCRRMVEKAGVPMQVYKTLDRRTALEGAHFVTTQLRVGQLKAREKDERIPLSHGYLGQETNGAGGLFKGLRTIPVIFDIVKDVQEICPDAWIINFTNPAGMVTEAVYRHTNFKRFIGVCNIPIGMKMFITDVLQLSPEDELHIDLFGLNHLVFVRDVLVNGESRFDELLDGVASGTLSANSVKNIFDLPFSEGLIRSLRLIPCSYLLYYFKPKEMLAIEMGEYYKGGARAQVVQKVEKQLFELYKNPDLKVKPKELEQRGGAYYSDAACEVINAIYNDKQAEHYVNIPHHGHIDNIPADWAVEMTCTLGSEGATPTPRITHFDEKVLGLIYTIKGFEVAASQAAISGELNDVLLALNLSPLIHSDRDAEQLAREMILAHEKWLPNFAATIEQLKQ